MPKPCPREFREDVIRVAGRRERGIHLKDIAADFVKSRYPCSVLAPVAVFHSGEGLRGVGS